MEGKSFREHLQNRINNLEDDLFRTTNLDRKALIESLIYINDQFLSYLKSHGEDYNINPSQFEYRYS